MDIHKALQSQLTIAEKELTKRYEVEVEKNGEFISGLTTDAKTKTTTTTAQSLLVDDDKSWPSSFSASLMPWNSQLLLCRVVYVAENGYARKRRVFLECRKHETSCLTEDYLS